MKRSLFVAVSNVTAGRLLITPLPCLLLLLLCVPGCTGC